SADCELLRLLGRLLELALAWLRKLSRQEAHLVALRVVRYLAERITFDDPRQIRRRPRYYVNLEPELRLDQTLALPRRLLGLRLAREDDVAAMKVSPHVIEPRFLQCLAQLRHWDAVPRTDVDPAQ